MNDAPQNPSDTFVQRRRRLRQLMAQAGLERGVIASGLPQPRNFAHNLYPFRASSHFLYLVGEPLEAALKSVIPYKVTPQWQQVSTLLLQYGIPAMNGQASPKDALAQVQAQAGG